MELTVEKIKEWRLKIDTLANSAKILKPSREVSLAFTNLQRSKMWLGQVLKCIGTPNPYPESKNPESAVIEPQTEHTNDTISSAGQEQISSVKLIRAEISKVTDEFKDCPSYEDKSIVLALTQSYISLIDSTMWLGMELNRIREENIKQ